VALDGPHPGSALVAGEESVRDIVLSERLGYSKPADIRKLIGRHIASLEAMGTLRHHGVMIEGGNGAKRKAKEYSLNRAQAAFIISKARTPEAANLAIVIAEVFALHSQGKLAPIDEAAAAELEAIVARSKARDAALAPGRDGWAIVSSYKRSGRKRRISARYARMTSFD
jgi:DNA polymerase